MPGDREGGGGRGGSCLLVWKHAIGEEGEGKSYFACVTDLYSFAPPRCADARTRLSLLVFEAQGLDMAVTTVSSHNPVPRTNGLKINDSEAARKVYPCGGASGCTPIVRVGSTAAFRLSVLNWVQRFRV